MILNALALKLKQKACGDFKSPYSPAIGESCEAGPLLHTPMNYIAKHLQQGIESRHFRVNRLMLRVSGFHSFNTARRASYGFEVMLWLRKGFGF